MPESAACARTGNFCQAGCRERIPAPHRSARRSLAIETARAFFPSPGARRIWPANDPYALLRNRDFLLYLTGRFIASFGQQMLAVALGWEIWQLHAFQQLRVGTAWA